MALGVTWKHKLTNAELYGNLPKASSKITECRMKLAGHIHMHPELTANKLLLWEPTHGSPRLERPHATYIVTCDVIPGIRHPT